jgi:hypothetical protein
MLLVFKKRKLKFNFQQQHRLRKNLFTLFLLAMISCTVIRCAKEAHEISPTKMLSESGKDYQVRLSAIKKHYYKSKLDANFKAKTEKGITWTPDWQNPSLQIINDSVSYLFFKLIGTVQRDGKALVGTEVNAATYLMIKNEKEFYRAFYQKTEKVSDKGSSPSYEKLNLKTFTGNLVLSNLESKRNYLLEYTNGHLSDTYLKKRTGQANKLMSVPGTVSYWEQYCTRVYRNCTYVSVAYSYCNAGLLDIVYSPTCQWPNTCGAYSMTDYDEVDICENIWFPDPPTEPGGGGGGGDDGNGAIIREVKNEVKSPCVKAAINKTLEDNVDIQGEMSDILKKFGAMNNGTKIIIKEDNTLKYKNSNLPKPGETTSFSYDPATNSYSAVININAAYFQETSVEAVAATLLHEFVHAYIGYANDPLLTQDHTLVSSRFINPMAEFLVAKFDISPLQAHTLAWYGLPDSKAYTNASSTSPALGVINGTPYYKGQVQAEASQFYYQGPTAAGTPLCKD